MIMIPEKKECVKLIGGDRWRNVEIVLLKLRIPKGQMKKNLIECSGKYVNPSVLESVKIILPTSDEE